MLVTLCKHDLLGTLHTIGNNGWGRNGQTDEMMPRLLDRAAAEELSLARINETMSAAGNTRNALHQLDRWESNAPLASSEDESAHETGPPCAGFRSGGFGRRGVSAKGAAPSCPPPATPM